eukprot:TRINITY_DN30010_c0_g1_i1.p1 TRINITY_DN30010_c0_g1~~TRINITY_DN30010_c0_g1_i1.p1  ORF type:complete len:515 (-),score=85.17 TRINITY_DN30010_c0_g1_i1:257-1627(-)
MVREHGFAAHGLTFDAKDVVKGEKMRKAMDSGSGNKCVEAFMDSIADQRLAGADSPEEASAFIDAYKPDIMLAHASFQSFVVLAERHQVPVVNVMFMPFLPSRVSFSAFTTKSQIEADGIMDAPIESHRQLWEAFLTQKDLHGINELRTRWGLPPHACLAELHAAYQAIPTANCWSSSVFPEPEDLAVEFPFSKQTGYVFVEPPPNFEPPIELKTFLDAPGKERPVYVGFGSLSAGDPRIVTEKVLRALMIAGGKRCVMVGGWSGIGPEHLDPDLTEDYAVLKKFADMHVVKVDAVPHSWLLPQCSAAVHHGGAGTIGAGVRAGVPTAIAPFAWDQPWWAEQLELLGVGFGLSGMISQVDAVELGGAIKRLIEDDQMVARAADLGARVRSEEGVKELEAFVKASLSAPFSWPTPAQPVPSSPPPTLWDRVPGHVPREMAKDMSADDRPEGGKVGGA